MKKYYFLSVAILTIIASSLLAQDANMVKRSKLPFPDKRLSNIWGYASGGKEYALVGHSQGAAVVDVTNPDSSKLLFDIWGPGSIWREIRTWQHYAYITNENDGGVFILDLSQLPDTVIVKQFWNGDSVFIAQYGGINQIHSLHIDNGYLYLYGGSFGVGGAVIADLSDPWNPVVKGTYQDAYIHDGMVYHDTIWAAHIYAGTFGVIDVTDKAHPVEVQVQETPSKFTHNTWLSDNKKVLYTTDEKDDSYLAAFDVSDINNIQLLGKVQSNPGSNSMVHNTYILNDYAVTSWYKDGAIIVDGHKPDNLVIVGNYDSSPMSGGGIAGGAWGVYPYLPSGNILISDIEEGMYVVTPTYKRACYLEGLVTDSITELPINDATVIIDQVANNSTKSLIDGVYKTGTPNVGLHIVSASKAGYFPKTITNIDLQTAAVKLLNIKLLKDPNYVGIINNQNVAGITLSPNPASESIKIENAGLSKKYTITDLAGRIMIDGKTNTGNISTSINISQLPKGLYFINLFNEETQSPAKILKFTKE